MDGEPPRPIDEVLGFDPFDQRAVIALGQLAGDGVLEVEPFSENQ